MKKHRDKTAASITADETDEILSPEQAFIQSFGNQIVQLPRKEFGARLNDSLERCDPEFPSLPPHLRNFLYRNAVEAKKRLAAWEATAGKLRSDEYESSVAFLKSELVRLSAARRILSSPPSAKAPRWIVPLARRLEIALQERLETNHECLENIQRTLQNLSSIRSLGRSDMTSYLLWSFQPILREELRNTPFRRSRSVILAAFAQAAELILPGDQDSDFLAVVKNRLARVKQSKYRKIVLHLFFQQTLRQWRASQTSRRKARLPNE